jgi:hypothetical protein
MDACAIVTEKIINLLKQGVVPWRRRWTATGLPRNLVSKKLYRVSITFCFPHLSSSHRFDSRCARLTSLTDTSVRVRKAPSSCSGRRMT